MSEKTKKWLCKGCGLDCGESLPPQDYEKLKKQGTTFKYNLQNCPRVKEQRRKQAKRKAKKMKKEQEEQKAKIDIKTIGTEAKLFEGRK